MSGTDPERDAERAGDACAAAAIVAVAPAAVGGLCLRARHGPTRDDWLARFATLRAGGKMHRIGPGADDRTLFGGLDIAASLAAGRAIISPGGLARAAGSWLVLASAERCRDDIAARIAGVMDASEHDSGQAFGLIALDEGIEADERLPDALAERLAIHLTLEEQPAAKRQFPWPVNEHTIQSARACLIDVVVDDDVLVALCDSAAALGIVSLRAPLHALVVARIAAALDERRRVEAADIALAARLVLAPRARQRPAEAHETETADNGDTPEPAATDTPPSDPARDPADQNAEPPAEHPNDVDDNATAEREHNASDEASSSSDTTDDNEQANPGPSAAEIVLEAVTAQLPEDVLGLSAGAGEKAPAGPGRGAGRRGMTARSSSRGRPAGTRAGMPDGQQRLDLMATLRAAAPWQTLRGRSATSPRLRIRADDFRVRRYQAPQESATLFVVDASGSSALHRLAETKGAVELLLADCYVRRDRVGLVAFRGRAAETLLPPTRSLTRARRALAGLPGGGPTPLAHGLDAAAEQAAIAARDGLAPRLVLLTDGRGNIARDGSANRELAARDVARAAGVIRAAGIAVIVIDTSPRPRGMAERLAEQLGGRYLALPRADASKLSDAVREAVA